MYLLSLLRDENLFFKYGEWGIKKSAFHTNFKNVTLILAKSAPKKSVNQKTVLFKQKKISVHFFLRSNVHFCNQYKKSDFLVPHSTYSKEKSVRLTEESMCSIFELIKSKMQATTQYFVKFLSIWASKSLDPNVYHLVFFFK
jgi:hypothetical protein